MGTPEFAVASLAALIENNFNIVGVVTSPDKPAGRGQKMSQSAVKQFAEGKNLPVLQPNNLKDESFHNELKKLNANLQIIVAFRMLPESVWNMPPLGSINLHASLLPHYRGAAPINWAVINGEPKTGVTTFFLKHEIDTGNIIFNEEIEIKPNDTAGMVHDQLMITGAKLLVKTTEAIINNSYKEVPQQQLVSHELKHAPKIFKDDCRIDWNQPADKIHNLVRGLSPYPTAWTDLCKGADKTGLKIFSTTKVDGKHNFTTGTIHSDNKSYLKVAVRNGFILIHELQLAGKKRMKTSDFLLGFKNIEDYIFD